MKRIFFALLIVALYSNSAFCNDYYIMNNGTRSSGSSTADTWTLANCYADIDTAADQVADKAGDRLILNTGETHLIGANTIIPATMLNRNEDTDYTSCLVDVEGYRFTWNSLTANLTIKGITFKDKDAGTTAVFILANATGTSYDANFTSSQKAGFIILFLAIN